MNQVIEVPIAPDNFLAIIEKAIHSPAIDIAKLSQLLDLQQRIIERNAETEFNIALSDMQPQLPIIAKTASMPERNNIKYAPYDEILEQIRELLGQYGFSVYFDVETSGALIKVTGTLAHRAGHKRTVSLPLMLDKSGNKQDIHAMGSTLSYGRRYALGLLLNIATRGEDDDGGAAVKNIKRITDDQILVIEDWIAATNSNHDKFLEAYKIKSLADIPASSFDGIIKQFQIKQERGIKS